MRVEIDWRHAVAHDPGDARIDDVALQALRLAHHVLEADVVARLDVGHEELVARRMDGHVEEVGADAGDLARERGRNLRGVDAEDVEVGQLEGHLRVPVPVDLVEPLPTPGVVLDDQARLRPPGRSARRHRRERADRVLSDHGRPVARAERRGVHAGSVGAHGEGARRVSEELEYAHGRPAEIAAERGRVEDPDERARDARRRELRVRYRSMLPTARGRDERERPLRAAEDDVARLVAHQEGASHPALVWLALLAFVELDDADAVGQVVHHPGLERSVAALAYGDGDGTEAHRHLGHEGEAVARRVEDGEPVVGCVDGEEEGAARRQRERAYVAGLEVVVVGRDSWREEGGSEAQQGEQCLRCPHGVGGPSRSRSPR